jgi:hypothetical protein
MAFSQQREISGTVLVFNKYPVKNLKVSAKKAKTETITDNNGEFKLNVLDKDVLSVEGITFEKYAKRLEDTDKSLSINMVYIDKKKNKEIAISNGFVEREHLEYGLKHLMDENTDFSRFSNVFDAIIYAIPTASPINENGQPRLQIRGNKSLTGSSAAITVLNGFVTDDISHINPQNIVSIKMLSPTAATMYGPGSANGVIEIKTK